MDYTTEGSKHPKYFDIDGKDPHLYKGKDGKMHARTRPEIEIATHFRIKYRSKMKKNLPIIINEQGAREILLEPVESIVTDNMDYLLITQKEYS